MRNARAGSENRRDEIDPSDFLMLADVLPEPKFRVSHSWENRGLRLRSSVIGNRLECGSEAMIKSALSLRRWQSILPEKIFKVLSIKYGYGPVTFKSEINRSGID
jgi:hypothetical protein